MRLTVLVENHTYIDQYYFGEPALSFYIENGEDKILFDTGYSHILMENARLMGIDLAQVNMVVVSHGHNDHTRGLKYFFREPRMSVMLISHPDCWYPKEIEGRDLSAPFTLEKLKKCCQVRLTRRPVEISENLTFLGEIPRTVDFEKPCAIGTREKNGERTPDFVEEDSALVYRTPEGIYIITGCSHCGICNIIEYAKEICGRDRVLGVIGGLHIFKTGERLNKTIEYFEKNGIRNLYPCHCTSFKARAAIHNVIPVHEVGVGFQTEW